MGFRAWFRSWSIPGSFVLGAGFVFCALAATRGEWVTFPLRPSLRAHSFIYEVDAQTFELSVVFAALVLGGAVVGVVSRLAGVVLESAALTLLIGLPVNVAWLHPGLVGAYVSESVQRSTFTAYVNDQLVNNPSPEPTFTPITGFETSAEQLGIGFAMLGWGWYIALFAVLGLFCLLGRGIRAWVVWPVSLGTVAVLSGCLTLGPLDALVAAQRDQDAGDAYLLAGNGIGALDAYSRALEQNPELSYSEPFLQKAAMAFNVASGGRHTLGSLGHDLELVERGNAETFSLQAQAARSRLLEPLRSEIYSGSGLESALVAAAVRLDSKLWLLEGLRHARERRYSEALSDYLNSREDPTSLESFYLAHAYLQLHEPERALDILNELEKQIGQPSIRADLFCTIGDAYTTLGDIVRARAMYLKCRELDKVDNFRAVKALSGS